MRKDITVTIENPNVFLQATFECDITRERDGDNAGQTWWEPVVDLTLIRVDLTNHRDDEFEWTYGENKPAAVERALELYEDKLEQLVIERVRSIVNDSNYEDNPYASDPPD